MLDFVSANLKRLAVTWVGNKNRREGIGVRKTSIVPLHHVAHEMMLISLLQPFHKSGEFYHFADASADRPHENPVGTICRDIFQDRGDLNEHVKELAARLYDCCDLPKIQGGEFFVATFDDLLLDGEPCEAIALWKVESKQPFFHVESMPLAFAVETRTGIPTGKPELAALIFNLDEADGYRVCAIDALTKKGERSFWKDAFLRLSPTVDPFYHTMHHIALANEFIAQRAVSLGADRIGQLDLLYKTGCYFRENNRFDLDDFAGLVFDQDAHRVAFREFRAKYAEAYAVNLEDNFELDAQAVKRGAKGLKGVLKLDKNFQIHVTGRRDLIERGYDEEKGKKYYKVYFDDED